MDIRRALAWPCVAGRKKYNIDSADRRPKSLHASHVAWEIQAVGDDCWLDRRCAGAERGVHLPLQSPHEVHEGKVVQLRIVNR